MFSLLGGILLDDRASAAHKGGHQEDFKAEKADKIASNLRDQIRAGTGDPSVVKVIVRLKDEISGQLNALLRSNGVKVKKQWDRLMPSRRIAI